jgi:hypothetical protein
LLKVSQLSIQEKHAGFAIPNELLLDGEPRTTRSGISHVDDLGQLGGDGVVDSGEDSALHPRPGRSRGEEVVGEDVVSECVLPDGEDEEMAPTIVVRRGEVEDDGN